MLDLGDCREQQHLRELEGEMTGRGWVRSVNELSDVVFTHPSMKWIVEITGAWDEYWALLHYGGGRYSTVQEGESLQELREALSSTGIEAPR